MREYAASDDFDARTVDAVLYNLVVIGEAANQLSPALRAEAVDIPWVQIVGLRNLIAHEYFRVDREVIREIVRDQLAELDRVAERLLEQSEAAGT
ncbi:MAG: DUF86 domain-containing protein [Gaiellaceae bacterium]